MLATTFTTCSRPSLMPLLLVVLLLSITEISKASRYHTTNNTSVKASSLHQKYKKKGNKSRHDKKRYGSKKSDCQRYGCSSKQCYNDRSCPTECHDDNRNTGDSIEENTDSDSTSFRCLYDELLKKQNMTAPPPSFKQVISLSAQQAKDLEIYRNRYGNRRHNADRKSTDGIAGDEQEE